MVIAFGIWSILAAAFLALGIMARRAEKPVGFWANAKAPEVTDTKKYNLAVSRLWVIFAVLFEIVGIPLLFGGQNSPVALLSILGTVLLVIGIMVAYTRIQVKYKA